MLNYPNDQPTQGTVINETAKYNLLEAARWGKFLAVVGFVTMGLMIGAGLFMGAFMATISAAQGGYPLSPAFFAVFYVILAAIYFYPVYALLKFSNLTKRALQGNDHDIFAQATGHLKGMLKYMGIWTIVIICIYALVIIFALTVGLASGLAQ
jgi:hypothetical protein